MQISGAPAVIVALPNRNGGVGRTTLALQLAGVWARERKRDRLVIDGPRHVARSMSSALLTAELVLTPAQPRIGQRVIFVDHELSDGPAAP